MVGAAIAITVRADNFGAEISDTDILFNPNLVRQSTVTAFATTGRLDAYDLLSVATHELAHALGANDPSVAAQGQFAGLDQINVRLPRTLIGRGPVFVEVRVDGQPANAVSIAVK